jgi:mannobiose 2-epimerase
MLARTILALLLALPAVAFAQTAASDPALPPTKDNYLRIAADVEKSLQTDDLQKFFPATIDPAGGFFETFDQTWTHTNPARDTTRSVVYQSRLTWLAAQAAMRYPDQASTYLPIVRHGAEFLMQKQWDKSVGGFWWTVDVTGQPRGNSKHLYGNAFALYALAAAFHATHDQATLDAAKAAFQWIETHAHDDAHGGYFEQLSADGSHPDASATGRTDILGARPGQKSMNAHIHLLETLTALLEVWPDPLVKKRTEEVYQIGLTKIVADPGYLHQYFAEDWTPTASADSYGHDIESAFLFAESAAALGKPDDPACWAAARKIVDHCLAVAYDPEGALNSEGPVDGGPTIDRARVWWVQAESLNALLLLHERFGHTDPRYWTAFTKQWAFIQQHQIDPAHGGWFNTLNPGNVPLRTKLAKTDPWTEGYHQGRAMLTVTARLKKLAGEK